MTAETGYQPGRVPLAREHPARPSLNAGAARPVSGIETPSLGQYLRQVREHRRHPVTGRRLSREQAGRRIGISSAYLVQIENGSRVPTMQALQLLATGYGLSDAQCQHIRELRDPPSPLADLEDTRRAVEQNTDMGERLQALDRAGVLAGYFDPLWHVVAGNKRLFDTFPGLRSIGNLAMWHFSDAAKQTLVDWEHEARHMVAMLKPALGKHRHCPRARELLVDLGADPDFCSTWVHSIDVAYTRATGDFLATKCGNIVCSLNMENGIVTDGTQYLRFCHGSRKPDSDTPRT